MVENRDDNQMIEIGDPTEEPSVATAARAPQVVIEYRERGVPWMLVPPLLVISAVGAILLYHKLAPPVPRSQSTLVAKSPAPLEPALSEEPVKPTPPAAEPVTLPPVVDKPTVPDEPAPPAVGVVLPPPTLPDPVPAIVAVPEPEKKAETATFPRVQGLGFDPKSLEAERKNDVPADPALAPARQEPRPEEPDRVVDRGPIPDDLKPKDINPDLLPPDPRKAQARQQQRLTEAGRQADADRKQFLSELRTICKKFGQSSAPHIVELCRQYGGADVEPAIQKRATSLLKEGGTYEGASRSTRIGLLRALGYPEPAVLIDLCEVQGRWESRAVRGGLNSKAEVMYQSAMILLREPLPRPADAPKAAPSPRTGPGGPAGS